MPPANLEDEFMAACHGFAATYPTHPYLWAADLVILNLLKHDISPGDDGFFYDWVAVKIMTNVVEQ